VTVCLYQIFFLFKLYLITGCFYLGFGCLECKLTNTDFVFHWGLGFFFFSSRCPPWQFVCCYYKILVIYSIEERFKTPTFLLLILISIAFTKTEELFLHFEGINPQSRTSR
jgi:hypothetical protein